MENHYHHCASCRHFGFREQDGKKQPMCTRLGYDTLPHYQFNCWNPKPRVKMAMQKKRRKMLLNRKK
ncbi:hypothetical protein PU629_04380 [Pullulanibacillus sp. KACC 23026]|nr:hypothetical protein [Pullulanibacillus sp. KACC 23026]WEG14894.1 hypothetical protein PU629_04380 [Pullulanibacillus sp. KACC 23026]